MSSMFGDLLGGGSQQNYVNPGAGGGGPNLGLGNWIDDFRKQLEAMLEASKGMPTEEALMYLISTVLPFVNTYFQNMIEGCDQTFSFVNDELGYGNIVQNAFNEAGTATYVTDGAGGWTVSGGMTPSEAQDLENAFASELAEGLGPNSPLNPIQQLQLVNTITAFYANFGGSGTNPPSPSSLASQLNTLWAEQGQSKSGGPPTPSWQNEMKLVNGDLSTIKSEFSSVNTATQANYQFQTTQLNQWTGSDNDMLHAIQGFISEIIKIMSGTTT